MITKHAKAENMYNLHVFGFFVCIIFFVSLQSRLKHRPLIATLFSITQDGYEKGSRGRQERIESELTRDLFMVDNTKRVPKAYNARRL